MNIAQNVAWNWKKCQKLLESILTSTPGQQQTKVGQSTGT